MNNDIEEKVNFYEKQKQSLSKLFDDPEFTPLLFGDDIDIIIKWNESLERKPVIEHNNNGTYVYKVINTTTTTGIIRKKKHTKTDKTLLFTIRNDTKTVFVYDSAIYKLVKRWAKENDMILLIKSWEGAKE